MAAPNIIVFGETGCGKSSVINMISGEDGAEVSSSANGVTFQSSQHTITAHNQTFHVFDTAGLEEGQSGSVPKQDAIIQLYRLMKSLQTGVSLLIFVMRGPRIKESVYRNWRLFYEVFCQKKVPITIAITGLENEADMDAWWPKNKGAFQRYEMNPVAHACITATKGRVLRSGEHCFAEEYEESKRKVWDMILNQYLDDPWKIPPIEWFLTLVLQGFESRFWGLCPPREYKTTLMGPGIKALVERCEMTEEEARKLVAKLES